MTIDHIGRMDPGTAIDETGLLVRLGGGFAFRRDQGGVWRLELHRVPVDLVGKRVRLIGVKLDEDRVEAEGVQPG